MSADKVDKKKKGKLKFQLLKPTMRYKILISKTKGRRTFHGKFDCRFFQFPTVQAKVLFSEGRFDTRLKAKTNSYKKRIIVSLVPCDSYTRYMRYAYTRLLMIIQDIEREAKWL